MTRAQVVSQARIEVDSLCELLEHEAEILRRIAAVPNGGNLFLAHPLLLLEDVGVALSDSARAEMLRREPALSGLSPTPYRALQRTPHPQRVRVELRGLFQKAGRP